MRYQSTMGGENMLPSLLTTNTDVEIIQGLFENLGVPIVIIIAMGAFIWFMYTQNREDRIDSEERWQELLLDEQERHQEEMKQFTEALNNNTVALTKLSALLGGENNAAERD